MAKLNIECVRDIMLVIEDKPYKETYNISTLHECLPPYSDDELEYCCYKLYEAGLLELRIIEACRYNGYAIKSINELTFDGHEFLETIRPKTVWDKTKSIISQAGTASLNIISDVASNCATELISNLIK